jgi:hypothetical protein
MNLHDLSAAEVQSLATFVQSNSTAFPDDRTRRGYRSILDCSPELTATNPLGRDEIRWTGRSAQHYVCRGRPTMAGTHPTRQFEVPAVAAELSNDTDPGLSVLRKVEGRRGPRLPRGTDSRV